VFIKRVIKEEEEEEKKLIYCVLTFSVWISS